MPTDLSLNERWRQVLELGQEIIRLGQNTPQSAWGITPEQRSLILHMTARLLSGRSALWLVDGTSPDVPVSPEPSPGAYEAVEKSSDALSPLMRQAMAVKETLCATSSQSNEFWIWPAGDEHASPYTLATPLINKCNPGWRDAILGVLQIERLDSSPFNSEQIALFEGLAFQIALTLPTSQQIAVERWRLEQLSLVRQVSAHIADVRNLDELALQVTDLIKRTFDYYYVAIFTLESGQDRLQFRASTASPHKTEDRLPLEIRLGAGIIGLVAQSGEEIIANDVRQETLFLYDEALPETRSEAALPLRIQERVLGVLDVQSDQLNDFDETDLLVLRALTDNIAVAVESTRLYNDIQERADHLAAIIEVSNAITSILDEGELLHEVSRLIQERFEYPYIHLFSVDAGRRKIIYAAGSGARSQALDEMGLNYPLDDPQGIIPWVARTAKTVLANDVSIDPHYRPSPLLPEHTCSELAVPMVFGDEVLGVLDIQSDQLNAFSEKDTQIIEALADQIAIALRNANLYRSEKWRRQAAESLREVAGLLSEEMDVYAVLDAILTELGNTLPLDIAAIWLWDAPVAHDEIDSDSSFLHLAAVSGDSVPELDLEMGLRPQEVLELNPQAEQVLVAPEATDWLLQALESDLPLVRLPHSIYEPLGAALNYPPDYSAIGAPLRVGERSLGVLTLAHISPGRYGVESRAMTAAFASYAAVAIENARIYASAHEQAWISTVLLQVAEATQSLSDLNDLLDTVTRVTPMVAGVQACLLYMLDDGEVFVPTAASGIDARQRAEFERWRFVPGDAPALEQLLAEQRPVILHDEDASLAGILAGDDLFDLAARTDLLVLVPLLSRGELLGAFLIDYRGERGRGYLNNALDDFFDETLAILQGIAHQTATAVESIRLLSSQKEDAYVSVALLQVAQAIVSSNELDETLSTIVRITPILVGVKRAVIYLWDETQTVFRLSQSYGLPRGEDEHDYQPGEFHLLDKVREAKHPIACLLGDEELQHGNILPSWADLPAPDPGEVDEFLRSEARLLLALPLSVKSELFGVLLAEEPEPALQERPAGERNNQRLRAKRLEILTGVSQQAALAIQNERLQHQMLERERLERELQLAREIQRTFLNRPAPQLPGWELNFRWRTAREVGGDFYDFFELPDGHLGLVIADVADKGMPAALYMTMIRALVRATVQQVRVPREVLERVNDVLVPDAEQGLFVTIFFGELSLESGELSYANAGHNPPLVLRAASGEIELLHPTGMALGVLEGNPLQAQQVSLSPGDVLILYTDGITEAFSPDGEIYGLPRLRNTICSATAEALLDAIDQSVTAFIGDAPLSDDLTLLVLRRISA